MKNEDLNNLLNKQPILLFDGECGFCNRAVQFFLRREKNSKMHFAALESNEGKALRNYFEIDQKIDSIILIKEHEAHIKSCAVLRMTLFMRGLWPLMIVFIVVPPFLRNLVYNFVAKKRKKIVGKVESCALLKQEDRARFLSDL
jgi:predicted DCC family thiol-disulfide oxidoreductase YuxK